MLLSIISIIANAVFLFVLNLPIYTDRAMMPNGEYRQWQRSPFSRLGIADQSWLATIQLAIAVICVVTSLLVIFGVKNAIIKKVQLIAFIASVAMFVIIMVVTSNIHAKYA